MEGSVLSFLKAEWNVSDTVKYIFYCVSIYNFKIQILPIEFI
jgi:hypothetical protein